MNLRVIRPRILPTDVRTTVRVDDLLALLRTVDCAVVPPTEHVERIRRTLALLLSAVDETTLGTADRAFVRGFLEATKRPARTGPSLGVLGPRQCQTLEWLLTGATEKEIAAALGLSIHTVHDYVKAIYRELRVKSRAQLMAKRLRSVDGDGPLMSSPVRRCRSERPSRRGAP